MSSFSKKMVKNVFNDEVFNLVLCIFSFQLSANVYSQIAKVSLEVKNASLEQVIQLLEKESGYIFLYEDAQIEQVQDLELEL